MMRKYVNDPMAIVSGIFAIGFAVLIMFEELGETIGGSLAAILSGVSVIIFGLCIIFLIGLKCRPNNRRKDN